MAEPAQEKNKGKVSRISTAKKRQLQGEKRRMRNKASSSRIRTTIRDFQKELLALSKEKNVENFREICSLLDKAAKKGLYTLNKASRLKSRLAIRLNTTPSAV